MRSHYLLSLLLFVAVNSSQAQDCDSVYITLITHPGAGGPLSVEWDLEDECEDTYLIESFIAYTIDDTTFLYTTCLDSGEYKVRVKVDDFSFEPGMFDIVVEMNGDIVSMNNDFDYGDDNLRYKFNIHSRCERPITNGVVENGISVSVYPVPADEYMELELSVITDNMTVEIMSSSGKVIRIYQVTDKRIVLDCGAWPPGTYVVVCKSESYNSIVASLLVSKQ